MAYVEKYSGKFTSLRGGEYEVVFYEEGGVAGSKTIKIQDLKLHRKENNRVLTSSVDIIFLNDYTYEEFDSLCNNTERSWLIQITEYGDRTNVFFKGWMAVDIIERDFSSDKSSIKITATDELLKLKDIEVGDVRFGNIYSFKEIIKDGLYNIDAKNIYINSALFYGDHTKTAGNTLFEQSYLDADYFYKNNVEILTYWDAINEILKTTNSYLYVHKDKYYIERYNDISTNANWVVVSSTTGNNSATTSQHESYSKQSDFDYINMSQVLLYESGLSQLTLNIDPVEYNSIVPSYWQLPLETNGTAYVTDSSIDYRAWTIFEEANNIAIGENNYGMDYYIKYDSSSGGIYYPNFNRELCPIWYKTKFTFNEGETNQLQLKWKVFLVDSALFDEETIYKVRFTLRLGEDSPYPNYYIIEIDSSLMLYDSVTGGGDYDTMIWTVESGEVEQFGRIIEFKKTIELEPIRSALNGEETLIFGFYPTQIIDGIVTRYCNTNIFGDFEVKFKSENIDNQYVYTINEGFVNKDEQDLKIFDLSNHNFKNGIYLSDLSKTDSSIGWTDDGGSTYDSLVDHFIKTEVGYYYKTRKGLGGDIIFRDEVFIKPLSFISDTHLTGVDFIAKEYTYNWPKSLYNFSQLKEYSSDKGEINIIVD
jgi:hypothetical protein